MRPQKALSLSISMALIIFLVVSYSLVIKSISSQELVLKGGYIYLSSNWANIINPRTFDPVLKANQDIIESFSYITPTIQDLEHHGIEKITFADKARTIAVDSDIFGVQPSFFESTVDDIVEVVQDKGSLLTLGE